MAAARVRISWSLICFQVRRAASRTVSPPRLSADQKHLVRMGIFVGGLRSVGVTRRNLASRRLLTCVKKRRPDHQILSFHPRKNPTPKAQAAKCMGFARA